jgi:hypothetical protein
MRWAPATSLEKIAERFYPYSLDIDRELKKIEIVRVITGIVAFIRFFQIYWVASQVHEFSGPRVTLAIVVLASCALTTVGLATPISAAVLLVFSRWQDNVFNTNTLGTSVLIQLLFVLILARAGRSWSIDALFTKNSKLLKKLYASPNQIELKTAYAFALIAYATVSFIALAYHLQDSYWLHGLTVKSLFVNSYLCKHYNWFRAVDDTAPWLLGLISISAEVAQSIFQFGMIPLMLWAPGRLFVRAHGTFFFLISLFFINLAFLPHWELMLWWLILFHRPLQGKATASRIPKLSAAFYNAYAAVMILFVGWISWQSQGQPSVGIVTHVNTITRVAGLEVPIVFDQVDLEMGDRWAEIYRKTSTDNDWTLTPITGTDGQRLNYTGFDILLATNHNSDLLYFGTTLQFQRRIIDITAAQFPMYLSRGPGQQAVLRRITYDYETQKLKGPVDYKIVFVETHGSSVELLKSSSGRLVRNQIYEQEYSFNGRSLTNR